MYPDRDILSKILVNESYISEDDSKTALAASDDSKGYVDYLISNELLTKVLLGQAVAEAYKLRFADLSQSQPTKETLDALPEDIAEEQRIAIVDIAGDIVKIASDQPKNLNAKKIKGLFEGKKVQLYYTLPEYIEGSLRHYTKPLETRFSEIIEKGQRVAPEILDEIIKDAAALRASDIHFEPQIGKAFVRYRVDGTLQQAGVLPLEQYVNILNRIKVESGMRIDEHNSPQDGSMRLQEKNIIVDVRVSLVPTVKGEKIVMRLLSSYVEGLSLADIGLDEAHQKLLSTYSKKPFGMILAVGPTGSGKSTTLYSLLRLLNKPDVNVTTIEDPVEYKMEGVNQIPVREQSGVTFAKGLRAIVRQDPDIILVGEIRDQETAEIAVNAALTGHLLLSTFHANNASTAIPRMLDMGIEPFLLASTLEIILAQRLIRKLCHQCRYSVPTKTVLAGLSDADAKQFSKFFSSSDNMYASKGCNACNGTGFYGRTALFEFIENTPELQQLVLENPSGVQIAELAKKQNMLTMFEDGMAKVKSGQTTLQEVLRVVEPPKSVTPKKTKK